MSFSLCAVTQDQTLKNLLFHSPKEKKYTVRTFSSSENLISSLDKAKTDLILLDYKITAHNADTLCREIKNDIARRHIPILLIIQDYKTKELTKAVEAGADDFLKRPFVPEELYGRININIIRKAQNIYNSLTNLEPGSAVLKETEKRITEKAYFCLGRIDIDRFKEHNLYYGFDWGDSIIKHTASLIYRAFRKNQPGKSIIAHTGGDNFLFVTSPDSVEKICQQIIYDFDTTTPSFYNEKDREKGYVTVVTRKGTSQDIAKLSLSIGIATNSKQLITHAGKMLQIADELKDYCAGFAHSNFLVDRRHIS